MPNSFVGTSDKVDETRVREADFRNGMKHAVQNAVVPPVHRAKRCQVRVTGLGA
jgi:hypothetical protein